MWGDNWGNLSWSSEIIASAAEVVPIAPLAVALLGFLVGVVALRARR